jgi:hypothetical protein
MNGYPKEIMKAVKNNTDTAIEKGDMVYIVDTATKYVLFLHKPTGQWTNVPFCMIETR